ncbi:hypothetical protein [Candidatus Phycosocius spiralis]|uniref:hypothetical protein n=1 Tax=Candidatus Phycosocius spiralis TaxID=2815099 RepID=UPI0024E0AB0E|nr:hypothetical protein [Candidatus Phycosocius spiralis]
MSMKRNGKLMRAALAASAWLMTSGLAPQAQPRITVEDLALCSSEIAEFHRADIRYRQKSADEICAKARDNSLYAPRCRELTDKANLSAGTSDMAWYIRGNDHDDDDCQTSSYPCYSYKTDTADLNLDTPDAEALNRRTAAGEFDLPTEAERKNGHPDFAKQYMQVCLARIWVAKKDGVAFTPFGTQQVSLTPKISTGSSAQSGAGSGGDSACADSPDATLERVRKEVDDYLRQNSITPPAMGGVDAVTSLAETQFFMHLSSTYLKQIELHRACLGTIYASTKAEFEEYFKNSVQMCRQLSSNPSDCSPIVPLTSIAASQSSPNDQGDKIAACTKEATQLQLSSQKWSGNVNDISARLGLMQRDLFQGRCAGHPEAAAYIAGANKMIGYGGNPSAVSGAPPMGSASGSSPTLTTAGHDTSASSTSSSTDSSVQDFPIPDRNDCLRVIEQTRGQECGRPNSLLVKIKNICPQTLRMHLCVFNSKDKSWECGSSTGRAGERDMDDVLQYACDSDGRFIYAACSEEAIKGKYRNDNCGGNPNKAGKHAMLPPN